MDGAMRPLEVMARVANEPGGYIAEWKRAGGGKVIAALPMNFPAEIAHAAGLLPVVVQEDRNPITLGNSVLGQFNCGYTRSLSDQAATGRMAVYDGFFMADHCIQLIGAADVIREMVPGTPFYFGQLMSSLSDPWTTEKVNLTMASFKEELEAFASTGITDDQLRESIRVFNRNRQLLRGVFERRRAGDARFSSVDLQVMITSSMVMQKEEHNELLAALLDASTAAPRDDRIRVHLSGHFCHAPRAELLALIEECGGIVVDDDLYHGSRYISTDVNEEGDPLQALSAAYLDKNVAIPCPTRAQADVDWDVYLLDAVAASGAEAVISLMAKYCEPHMLYYPQLKKALEAAGIPHLLLETEHEGMPLQAFRTRIEAMFERTQRLRADQRAAAGP